MKLTTLTNKTFNLPKNFQAELDIYNILLSDVGDQTAPITLPPTPGNLELVGYSNRIDAAYKPITDLDVVISDGLFVRPANLGIHLCDEDDGISCTLYLGTGQFYSLIDEQKLSSLAWPVLQSPTYNSQTLAQRVQYLIDVLKAAYAYPGSYNEFRVAPLITDKTVNVLRSGSYVSETFILNGFNYSATLTWGDSDTCVLNKFWGEVAQTFKDGDVPINCSIGYGMTPFLSVKYVLQFLFSQFGFTLDVSEITAIIPTFSKICLENNVADAIYAGRLKYSQLVPDLTIKEFLNKFSELFAGKFIVNNVTKVAKFRMYRNCLPLATDFDLSPYLSSKIKPASTEFVNYIVKKTTEPEPENTTKLETETLDLELRTQLGITFTYPNSDLSPSSRSIRMTLMQSEGLNHLNSSLVVAGEPSEDDIATSSKLHLLYIANEWSTDGNQIIGGGYEPESALFRITQPFLTEALVTFGSNIQKIKSLYTEYVDFRANSNIPISATFTLPETVLDKLDLSKPKYLNSQRYLIEQITQVLNEQSANGTKKVSMQLRTLRNYLDRE